MARSYTMREVCAEPACNEVGLFEAGTRREQQEHYRRYRERPWKCSRHIQPDRVLTPENTSREHVLVSYETDHGYPEQGRVHRYWTTPEKLNDEKKGGNGFVFGEGFKAWAKDFPTGTRLIVTARVEIPSSRVSPPANSPQTQEER